MKKLIYSQPSLNVMSLHPQKMSCTGGTTATATPSACNGGSSVCYASCQGGGVASGGSAKNGMKGYCGGGNETNILAGCVTGDTPSNPDNCFNGTTASCSGGNAVS